MLVMITREIAKNLKEIAKQFRVVALTGPRQSGKTTLLKEIFKDYKYFNLESLDTQNIIGADKAGFVRSNKKVIIDEIQKMPELMSMIQAVVDERNIKGDFIISGSENLLLSEKISQSLAGRASYSKLLPLSILELKKAKLIKSSFEEQILFGFYPAIYSEKIDIEKYYDNYIQTYLERDLRNMQNIQNLNLFRKFIALLAGRIGQLVNYESLANDVGVSRNTIESWISILEASFLVFRLQPYYENFGKRNIKSAKVYFTDVGLACYLLTINSTEELEKHYLRGGLFENMCILEIYKHILNNGINANLFFYRDSSGKEVDLLIKSGLKMIPIEIKSSSSFSPEFLKGIEYWRAISKKNSSEGVVIYAGESLKDIKGIRFLNWKEIEKIFSN